MDFLILVLLVGMGVAAYFFWKQQSSAGKTTEKTLPKHETKPYSPDELRMENVKAGGVLQLRGVGKDMEDFDVKVVSKHTYRQGESSWYELECDKGDDKVWISLEEDDDLEMSISMRKLKLRDLGIKKDDLMRFDEAEEGSFHFEDRKYWLEDSDAAVFYRHSADKEAEQFYYWEFEDEKSQSFISVEKWSDGSYDVTYSEPVKASQITVYSLS